MKIEPILLKDLPEVKALQPPTWRDILPSFEFYITSDFCFPLKCILHSKVVGIGSTILHEKTAWLGHIIVDPQHRNKGIGTAITQALIDSIPNTTYQTISLVATPLGEPIYARLGFEEQTEYVYMKGGRTKASDRNSVIRYDDNYKNELLELDKLISGETRSKLFDPHLIDSLLLIQHNRLVGFYMPTLGDGLIVAKTPEAGVEFLTYKYTGGDLAAIPVENKNALDFMKGQGYTEYARGSRMWLGKKLDWQADKIYSRIGGNLG